MSNNFDAIKPKLIAAGLQSIKENCVMPRLLNRDFANEAAKKGDTINVPIPAIKTAKAVTPSVTMASADATTITSVPIVLSNWYHTDFELTDKEQMEVENTSLFPMQAQEAINGLIRQVDQDILALYKKVYGVAGVAGTTPFASTVTEATAARKILNIQLAPPSAIDRHLVIDPEAEASALNLRAFTDASFTGDASAIQDGNLIRRFGFNWFLDQNIPTHTAGVPGGTITVNGAHATTGVTTVSVANSAAGTLLEGDIITFAGDTQTYTVGADVTWSGAGNQNVTISPGLQIALAGSNAITLTATHTVNLAFHRNAFAMASRPLQQIDQSELGVQSMSQPEPETGLVLRLRIQAGEFLVKYTYDILYGVACIRPEFAVRLMG
jgi:hypothetical protein